MTNQYFLSPPHHTATSLAKVTNTADKEKWQNVRTAASILNVDFRAFIQDQRERRKAFQSTRNEDRQKSIKTSEIKTLKTCGKVMAELEKANLVKGEVKMIVS